MKVSENRIKIITAIFLTRVKNMEDILLEYLDGLIESTKEHTFKDDNYDDEFFIDLAKDGFTHKVGQIAERAKSEDKLLRDAKEILEFDSEQDEQTPPVQ